MRGSQGQLGDAFATDSRAPVVHMSMPWCGKGLNEMAQVMEQRAVTSELPADTVIRQLVAKLTSRKHARIERVDNNSIEGHLGSKTAFRLKGGWIASTADFPVVVAVALQSSNGGSDVSITVADDLGFGLKWGIQKKYERAASEVADALVAAVVSTQEVGASNEGITGIAETPVAGEGTTCLNGHPVEPSVRFCPQCGALAASPPLWSESISRSEPIAPKTNGLAVASMVLGILWIFWLGSILAVVFGHISIRQIRRRHQPGRGIAIAGLVLGWLEVAGLVAVVVVALVVAVNNEDRKPASQIFKDAVSASSEASSVHIFGSESSSSGLTSLNLVVSPDVVGGTISEDGANIDVVVANGEVYLKADADFWQQVTSNPSSIQSLSGTWIEAPASNSDFAGVASLTDIWKQLKPQGTLTKGSVATENGMAVIPLSDSRSDTSVYVADSGPPYIVSVIRDASSSRGYLTFDNYGQAAIPSVPTDAVDVSQYLH